VVGVFIKAGARSDAFAPVFDAMPPSEGPEVRSPATIDPAALDAVLASADQWSFLDIVPSLLFAAANYLAWDRIRRGEIPERPHLPSMPGAPQA